YRFKALAAFAVAAPLSFVALPESLQTRFETIINPDVGPKNAEESGQGRIEGLTKGFELWQASPLTGVGPGAWRPPTRSKIESHNLYGQLMGETGALGVSAFVFLLGCFWMNLRAVKRAREYSPDARTDFLFLLPTAIGVSVFLLLFMGNFGHNLFRFTWLWFGGVLIVARSCVPGRVGGWDREADRAEDGDPPAAGALPPGWFFPPPHVQ